MPLVPRSFNRDKEDFDKEVESKRRYREAWAAGMHDADRKCKKFPLEIVDSEHFTAMSVVRSYRSKSDAVERAAEVVEGFLEVSHALGHEVNIVAEVSVYGSDFQRQN